MIPFDNMHEFNQALSGTLEKMKKSGRTRHDDTNVQKVKDMIANRYPTRHRIKGENPYLQVGAPGGLEKGLRVATPLPLSSAS